MIEILKKHHKIGDVITIISVNDEITGKIECFEDSCIIIETETSIEVITYESIRRFSSVKKPKSTIQQLQPELINKTDNPEEITKPSDDDNRKFGIKIVGKIDLDKIIDKRKRENIPYTYRLSKIAREFNLTVKEIVVTFEALSIDIVEDPSTRITASQYNVLKEYFLKKPKNLIAPATDYIGIKVNSLDQLNQIKEKIIYAEGKQPVAANAIIKKYWKERDYGFITDSENKDYYFRKSSVIDSELLALLSKDGNEGIHIICATKNFGTRVFSTALALPNSIENLYAQAENLFENQDFDSSLDVLTIILNTQPTFHPAIELEKKLNEFRSNYGGTISPEEAYVQARNEIRKGNVSKGKELLFQALLLKDYRAESSLKELSYILQREGNIDSAIELIKKNEKKIKTSDPNSLIAYFYETKKEYNTALIYLNNIVPRTQIEEVKVNKRKAFAYFGMKDYQNVSKYLTLVLKKQPQDFQSQKLLEGLSKITEKGIPQEIEAIFNEAELASLSGGQSPYIQFSLDKCSYSGVPSYIVSQQKFTPHTLKELRKLIEGAGKARPKERAGYLLTEAKLMSLIEPEREREVNGILAGYCTAVCQNSAIENAPVDTIQFFLIEAFKLGTEFSSISPYLPIYIESFFKSSFEAYKSLSKPIDHSIKDMLQQETKDGLVFGLIDAFQVNTTLYSKLLTSIYKNESSRKLSFDFLSKYTGNKKLNNLTKEQFQKIWNESLEQRKREKSAFTNSIVSLTESNSIESIIESINQIILALPNWLNQQDRHRIKTLGEIANLAFSFLNQKAFEDKERFHNLSINQIIQLVEEIETLPTELSFNSLRQALDKILSLLQFQYINLIEISKPQLSISILGEGVVQEDRTVLAQYCISSRKGSAPISWLSLVIEGNDELSFIEKDNILEQTLKGDDEKILRLNVRISDRIQKEGATNIKVICSYKIRGSEDIYTIQENLSLRLYSETEFEKIENTFATTADSGPVMDDSMFFGRDEFIDNITASILDSSSKCIIIYGQKRSGKSSVLHHLKEKLNKSQKSFCISFSLGEIVDQLSALTFYYTVLTEVQDSLDDLRDFGIETPHFEAPTLLELQTAPSIVFNDMMKELKKSMSQHPEWKNKKLILLLDEFTYIYSAIQKNILNDQFMKTWKSFLEKGHFSSVLIGQDIMPKFTEAYPNEFGVTEPKRLSYLNREDARKLIENPIWDHERNRSRLLGNAVEMILDYTSSNPYYVQIFCARMVEYMNNKKIISITEADVLDVAQSFIVGEQSLTADKFDNLITAGDADLEANSPKDVLRTLKEIALSSKNLDSCHRDAISLNDKIYEDAIISDLRSREVISSPAPNYYKINVRLFKEWLLHN